MAKNNVNPADFLLGANNESQSEPSPQNVNTGKTIYRAYEGEARSKRTLIAMTPTLYDSAKKRADSLCISFNEYINQLIKADLNEKND